ncbi:hypothetical protein K4L06_15230 [Lysobacter sp. BMK333-48F3]|uniref:hypothetical protein n=1 Tax=Lysobacter sp. BMK333-48F3 TaxID=2867962 RepID=UPI001C8BC1CA|nr:hypothetical protein [Lysobacter sp. BMK333-48F3]MBX9402661.1 hypothetical protein [Lysobacter sp. BMK333-48F3]
MSITFRSRALRATLAALVLSISLTGCMTAKFYVDPALPTVAREDLTPAASPQPVQLLSEFRTQGNANPRASTELRLRAMAAANASGLFSQVGYTPAAGGAQLRVIVDNVPLTKNLVARGVASGMTLGLAGTLVTDGYNATVSYTANGKTTEAKITHAVHTTVGNKAGPAGAKPMSVQAASQQMMDQIVWNGLKQLSEQRAFDAD